MDFKIGDILLYESETFFGRAVRKVTGFKYSHVAIAVGNKDVIEANAFIKTRRIHVDETKYKHIRVMRLKDNLADEQQKTIVKGCDELLGLSYDYWGVFMLYLKITFGMKLDPIKDDVTRVWCSELTDFVYLKAGVDLVPAIHNSYVSVQDIAESSALIHVGDLYAPRSKSC